MQTVQDAYPPWFLLLPALQVAKRRRHSVFVYHHHEGWAIAEESAEAAGFAMIEVAPDPARGETHNRGGC